MDALPDIYRTRETQLDSWPVISSILFEIATSDDVPSIFGIAGLKVDWSLTKTESFSHLTRKRAYRPRVDQAFSNLDEKDKTTVLALTVAELARKYPAQIATLRKALSRIGWTLKTATIPDQQERTTPMRRDKELQRLLLLHVRDRIEPPELKNYSEEEQVYNAALLINGDFVEGQAIQGGSGQYVSTVMTQLTSKGHDFLEGESEASEISLASNSTFEIPPELAESIKKFKADHPDTRKSAFIMMRFGTTKAHNEIIQTIRSDLGKLGIQALRADDKDYHDDLFWNILTYVFGCGFGVAVFERIEQEEFNPNIALEVGYMMALKKPVLLLKDKTLKNLNTDLIGKLYKIFDPQSISESIGPQLKRWLKDKGLV
jgi:Hypothetical protein (DUF2513)